MPDYSKGFFPELVKKKEEQVLPPQLFNFDKIPLKLNNAYDIPQIEDTPIQIQELIPFHFCQSTKNEVNLDTVHFFLVDSLFERVWNNPDRYISVLKRFNGTFSPDFSVYLNMPLTLQLFNIYRSRWCAAFWQYHEISVIPTLSWGNERTFDFAFLGLEKCSQVAVSSMGIIRTNGEIFKAGFLKMVEYIKPKEVIWYGNMLEEAKDWHGNIRVFEPFFRKFEA